MKDEQVKKLLRVFPELKPRNGEKTYLTGLDEGSSYAIVVTVKHDTDCDKIIDNFESVLGCGGISYVYDPQPNTITVY